MTTLFLAHRVPWPPDRGDRIRSYHILKALAALGPVRVVAFADDPWEVATPVLPTIAETVRIVPRTRSRVAAGLIALATGRPVSLTAFDSRAMRRAVAGMLDGVDRVFAFSGQMAQFVPAGVPRFVMDFVDVDSAKFAPYAQGTRGPMRWLHAREARLLAAFEAGVADRADLSLFVSEAEAALFRSRSGAARVAVLENGINLIGFDPDGDFDPEPAGEGPLIVFTGQMDYAPNVDAVAAFARGPFARIRAARADARFAIVGRAPVAAVRALAALPGVIVTGAVPDVRGWLAAADVVVAPLLMARGVQNKVLEAMAMARPVVASPQAHEGIDAVPGRDLIVATPEAQARAVLRLIDTPAEAAALGRAARTRMIARYAWDARLAGLPAIMGLPA